MKNRLFVTLASVSLVTLTACSTPPTEHKTTTATSDVTFVLVHGALFTGGGWTALKSELTARGQKSVSLNVPGRSGDNFDPKLVDLAVASQKVCDVISEQVGNVILVGHSQGGALISEALGKCGDKVLALVYVAAVVPLHGEAPFQGLDPKVDVGFAKVAKFDPNAKLFRVNKKGPIRKVFFADISETEAKKVISEMVSEPAKIGMTPLTTSNEKLFSTHSYYVETLDDQVISIESQRRFYSRIPGIKVFSMKTSHSPFLSKPAELAQHLLTVKSEAVVAN